VVTDVTGVVENYVVESSVHSGVCILTVSDGECSLTLSEEAPAVSAPGVAASSLTIPLLDGQIYLGPWSNVLLRDRRGPRLAALEVTIVGG
jgi:thiamine phosphate synthase YjbQ (UPF0047 family)